MCVCKALCVPVNEPMCLSLQLCVLCIQTVKKPAHLTLFLFTLTQPCSCDRLSKNFTGIKQWKHRPQLQATGPSTFNGKVDDMWRFAEERLRCLCCDIVYFIDMLLEIIKKQKRIAAKILMVVCVTTDDLNHNKIISKCTGGPTWGLRLKPTNQRIETQQWLFRRVQHNALLLT